MSEATHTPEFSENDYHVIPPARLDQCASVLAQCVRVGLLDIAGEDENRRFVLMSAFLHQLTALPSDPKKIAGIIHAVADNLLPDDTPVPVIGPIADGQHRPAGSQAARARGDLVSATAHTPGPWSINIASLTDNSINAAHVIGPQRQSIAQIAIYDEATTEANAQLIAAAPDLLSALKDLTDSHELTIYGEGYDPEHCNCQLLDVARAAIVKATGAAP